MTVARWRARVATWVVLLCAACTNFHAVDDRMYRSGQPSAEQLREWIDELGIKTVLRLRGGGPGNETYEQSAAPARDAGIAFVHVPISSRSYPSRADLLRLWDVFERAEYPVLVHCYWGADRTGLATGLYVLQRTGDLDLARDQLSFWPYLHTGLKGAWRMDRVFELYAPFATTLSFPTWVRECYVNPEESPEPARRRS